MLIAALMLGAAASGAVQEPAAATEPLLDLDPRFTDLWIARVHGLPAAEQTLVATLQGLVRGPSRIWIRQGEMNVLLIEEMIRNGVRVHLAESAWQLVGEFREQVKGAIVYQAGTPSLNAATSMCGLLDAVALDETLLPKAAEIGLPVVKDARGYDQERVLKEFGGRFNKSLLIEQSDGIAFHLRDFAVAQKAFVLYGGAESFRAEVGKRIGNGIPVYGWTGDESGWILGLSKRGNWGIPADWSMNLSVLPDLGCKVPKRPQPRKPAPARDGERVLAFVMTDGDNLQWVGGEFVRSPGHWASPHRGEFSMTWEMAPALAERAPAALGLLYAMAATGEEMDDFVAGASGAGYAFHHHLPDRERYAHVSGAAMRNAQLTIATMLNADEGGMEQARELLERPEVDGVLYKDYGLYNNRRGTVLWHEGKPCIAYKFLLWEGIGPDTEPRGLAEAVRAMPAKAATDAGSYALVNVHAWSFKGLGGPMAAVRQTIALLPEGTRVVTATEFVALLRSRFAKQGG